MNMLPIPTRRPRSLRPHPLRTWCMSTRPRPRPSLRSRPWRPVQGLSGLEAHGIGKAHGCGTPDGGGVLHGLALCGSGLVMALAAVATCGTVAIGDDGAGLEWNPKKHNARPKGNGTKLFGRACGWNATKLLRQLVLLLANGGFFTRIFLLAQFLNRNSLWARLAQKSVPPKRIVSDVS